MESSPGLPEQIDLAGPSTAFRGAGSLGITVMEETPRGSGEAETDEVDALQERMQRVGLEDVPLLLKQPELLVCASLLLISLSQLGEHMAPLGVSVARVSMLDAYPRS